MSRRDFLVLEVQDNGMGIEQKNLKAIFGAGYTTKREGSGLGLHSAANFVTNSGGKIQPLSDGYGTGTTMRVSNCGSIPRIVMGKPRRNPLSDVVCAFYLLRIFQPSISNFSLVIEQL